MSEKMKAALFGGVGEIEIHEVEKPTIQPGCVLIEMKACGICGSDLHFYHDEWEHREVAHGHEVTGVVVEVGEGVDNITPGDRVCVEAFSHCGHCVYCKTGLYNLCANRKFDAEGHGGFAEFTLVDAKAVFPIPDSMTFERGALVEPLAVGYRAFHLTGPRSTDTVVILGAGMIGLCALASATAAGVRDRIITAKYDHQADMTKDLGAACVVRVPGDNLEEIVKERTGGMGADAVVDTVSRKETVAQALSAPRRKGRVVFVGGFTGPVEADLGKVIHSELAVTGSCCYGYTGMQKDFDACMELIHSGRFDFDRLITHRFPLEEIAEAFRIAADKTSGSIKVMICR
ncbi:MAG: alcohol dehydrogenase catalytic domain-containing protein [Planctomycetes bacterium]|nr:alcohol dehydrogenase catalytic domain-containing protein [Planctomycetota bacterium]